MRCGHCNCEIKPNGRDPLYRTCDSYVCSPICSLERLKVITKLDPSLTNYMSWAKTTTASPPKTFERKVSYVTLGSLSSKAEELSDKTTPLLNERCIDTEYQDSECDAENNNRVTDNRFRDTTMCNILYMTEEVLALACVSAVTVGMLILLG